VLVCETRERRCHFSTRQLLDEAAAGGYGFGAFNVNDMEQIQGIMHDRRCPDAG
jgi:fructose/tagatose bisphosphate aldolase